MRSVCARVALLVIAAAAIAVAQYRDSNVSGTYGYGSPAAPNTVPEGTRFVVLLNDKLDTSKSNAGKRFTAKLAEDLQAADGSIIPRGKKIKGHVSEAEKGFHARLLLSFDQIETQHGWMPVAATVSGVPGEHGIKATGSEGEIQRGINKKRTIETAAAGAAVGAVAGTVAAGPGGGTLIGAAVGGAAGAGTGLLTGRNLKLNKGTQLELRLDRPLPIPAQ